MISRLLALFKPSTICRECGAEKEVCGGPRGGNIWHVNPTIDPGPLPKIYRKKK